ncbi:MAG: SDR family oxidoreductase [Armatimonadaceae bacterium]
MGANGILMETSLNGKTVLITGATGGIGSHTARMLAQNGAKVLLSGRSKEKLDAVAAEIAAISGETPPTLRADLTDATQVQRLLNETRDLTDGALDILVNAAGIGAIKPVTSLTQQDFYSLLAINLYGAMVLSQETVKLMIERKSGHIVHVIGILGKAAMLNATAYCASKYGLSGFLEALRLEVSRRHNIKVTGLYLGGVDTPFYDNPNIEMKVQRDKMLSPDDASRAILYALTQPAHLVLGELTLQPESHQL